MSSQTNLESVCHVSRRKKKRLLVHMAPFPSLSAALPVVTTTPRPGQKICSLGIVTGMQRAPMLSRPCPLPATSPAMLDRAAALGGVRQRRTFCVLAQETPFSQFNMFLNFGFAFAFVCLLCSLVKYQFVNLPRLLALHLALSCFLE